jgi:uncharacterized protein (DUF2164 family)
MTKRVQEPSKALEILAYATRKNDMEMANMAARFTIDFLPEKVFPVLEPQGFLNWVCRMILLGEGCES